MAGGAFYPNPFPDAGLRGVCEAKMSVGGTLTAGALAPATASATTQAARADFHTVAALPPTCYQSLKPSRGQTNHP